MVLRTWLILGLLLALPASSASLELRNLEVKRVAREVESVFEANFEALLLADGVPSGPIRYQAEITGYRHSQTLNGEYPAQRGINSESFRFRLPREVPEGPFRLRLTAWYGRAQGTAEVTFQHYIPAPRVQVSLPTVVLEGDSCTIRAVAYDAIPPLHWIWQAGQRSGEADGSEIALTLSDLSFPKQTVVLFLHDGVHQHPHREIITVRVDKRVGPDAEVTPIRESPLTATLGGPSETLAGQSVVYSVQVEGGVAPYKYHWYSTAAGGAPSGESCQVTFTSAGAHEVKVLVVDSDRSSTGASFRVNVYEPLQVEIAGPSRATSGQRVDFTARVRGGREPYSYSWTTSGGGSSSAPGLAGILRGQPGDLREIRLTVQDSLDQSATTTAILVVSEGTATGEGVRYRGELNPAVLEFMRSLLGGTGLGLRQTSDLRVTAPPLTLTLDAQGRVMIQPAVILWEESYLEHSSQGQHRKMTRHRFEFGPGRAGAGGRMAGPCRVTSQKLVDGRASAAATTRTVSWAVLQAKDGVLYLLPNFPNLPGNFLHEGFTLGPNADKIVLVAPYRLTPLP